MEHMITTAVPIELAGELFALAGRGRNSGLITYEGAGYLMAIGNAIVASADKTPHPHIYNVPPYWRPYHRQAGPGDLPGVVITVSEQTRRDAASAAGTMARRTFHEPTYSLGTYCRDWIRYDLRDGMTDPVIK